MISRHRIIFIDQMGKKQYFTFPQKIICPIAPITGCLLKHIVEPIFLRKGISVYVNK